MRNAICVLGGLQVILLSALIWLTNENANLLAQKDVFIEQAQPFPNMRASFRDCVVRIRMPGGIGSGVIVAKDKILTNFHVVAGARAGKTVIVDAPKKEGGYESFVATISDKVDEARDLAYVNIPKEHERSTWATFEKRDMRWGERVIVVGCGNANLPIPTVGFYCRQKDDMVQYSVLAYEGNSGGAVFSARTGNLVGMIAKSGRWSPIQVGNNMVLSSPPYIYYGVPSRVLSEFMAH